MKKKILALPALSWIIIFTVLPLFIIGFFSVSSGSGVAKISLPFTLQNYKTFFEPIYLGVFSISLKLSLASTLICLAAGYPAAYILAKKKARTRSLLLMLIILPQWTNFLLRTYAWMSILRDKGLINNLLLALGVIDQPVKFLYSQGAVLMGMVYNFLPYMIIPVHNSLVKIDYRYIEAAKDLGADNMSVFKKVIFPLSSPGVVSGIIMVFLPAMSTFVISDLLGGGQFMLMGNLIQNQFLAARNWQFGSAISQILIFIILISMIILDKYQDKAGGGDKLW